MSQSRSPKIPASSIVGNPNECLLGIDPAHVLHDLGRVGITVMHVGIHVWERSTPISPAS
jgi:hypothetical protein